MPLKQARAVQGSIRLRVHWITDELQLLEDTAASIRATLKDKGQLISALFQRLRKVPPPDQPEAVCNVLAQFREKEKVRAQIRAQKQANEKAAKLLKEGKKSKWVINKARILSTPVTIGAPQAKSPTPASSSSSATSSSSSSSSSAASISAASSSSSSSSSGTFFGLLSRGGHAEGKEEKSKKEAEEQSEVKAEPKPEEEAEKEHKNNEQQQKQHQQDQLEQALKLEDDSEIVLQVLGKQIIYHFRFVLLCF